MLTCCNEVWQTHSMLLKSHEKRNVRKSKQLLSPTKELTCVIYNYLENQGNKARILDWTAKTNPVSRRTVTCIRQEQRWLRHGDSFASSAKCYQQSQKWMNSDDFDREVIQQCIFTACMSRKLTSPWTKCWIGYYCGSFLVGTVTSSNFVWLTYRSVTNW